jgi:hypothetical protein
MILNLGALQYNFSSMPLSSQLLFLPPRPNTTAHRKDSLTTTMAVRDDARTNAFVNVPTAARSPTPEPDCRRGRPRHRSLCEYSLASMKHGGTSGSSTLRGRSRRRSISPYLAPPSRPGSGAKAGSGTKAAKARPLSLSPTRSLLFIRVVLKSRHRSQSPSRSRSPNSLVQKLRRRQRTRSRSRTHPPDRFRGHEIPLVISHQVDHSQAGKGRGKE